MNKLPTVQEARKIRQAIAEWDRLIQKEERYSKDLQKADYLNGLYTQKNKLQVMLDTGEGLPVV